MRIWNQLLNLPRYGLQTLKTYSHSNRPIRLYGTIPNLPIPPALSELSTDDDNKAARVWVDQFKAISLPRTVVELTFARSPGPGGQNVNKVNTKALARCPLPSPWIPFWALPSLKKTPFYVASSRSLLVSSTVYRSQSQNVDDCLLKLHSLVLETASNSIKNETPVAQQERVKRLQSAQRVKRRKDKIYRSQVKKDRSYRD